jgi:Domain of unknown function (DUF5658)
MARVCLISVVVCLCTLPAAVQDPVSSVAESPVPIARAGVGEVIAVGPAIALTPRKRPVALAPLYVSYSTLQVIDVTTTMAALKRRTGREGNPMMGLVVDHPVAFVAVKAGSTAATIWLSERLWKRHRVAAVATMIGMNAAMAIVVGHNAAVDRLR